MRWIIELRRLLPAGRVTLRDIYRCTVDTELLAQRIGEGREQADRLCPVRAIIANGDLAAHKEPLGDWAWAVRTRHSGWPGTSGRRRGSG